jgi:uncharacterized Tic20 family protein
MNQPDLGLKVAELRQLKGLTQEQLAEKCEVSPRTIQRIESGEVDPRSYTLRCLGDALDFEFGAAHINYDPLWLALMHLSTVVLALPVPLVLWLWKKNHSSTLDVQGRQVINFQITMILLLFLFGLYMVTGLVAFPAILTNTVGDKYAQLGASLALFMPFALGLTGMLCVFMGVINTIWALTDRPVRYPLSIPFIR